MKHASSQLGSQKCPTCHTSAKANRAQLPATWQLWQPATYHATVTAQLPAVLSVNEKINEPHYPTFKGIMAAKKKPVQVLTLADLSVPADAVGLDNAASWVDDFAVRPPRQAGVVVKDEGDGGSKVAGFLAEQTARV